MSQESIKSIQPNQVNEALKAVESFLKERPGFSGANYATASSYRSDLRRSNGFKQEASEELTKVNALVASGTKAREEVSNAMTRRLSESDTFRLYREDGQMKAAFHTYGYGPVEKRARARDFLKEVRESAEKSLGVDRPTVSLNAQWNRHPPTPAPVSRSRGIER